MQEGCKEGVREPSCKIFLVYDGEEIGKEYDIATAATNINGKLAFVAQKDKEIEEWIILLEK